jgi:hypothetical protein
VAAEVPPVENVQFSAFREATEHMHNLALSGYPIQFKRLALCGFQGRERVERRVDFSAAIR